MKEQFVTYEIALKLKELGFNQMYFGTFDEDGHFDLQDFEQNYDTFPSHMIAAPLYQQVIDWFREKDIVIEVRRNFPKDQYFYTIGSKTFQHVSESTFNYWKAREQAILKTIELCQKN